MCDYRHLEKQQAIGDSQQKKRNLGASKLNAQPNLVKYFFVPIKIKKNIVFC